MTELATWAKIGNGGVNGALGMQIAEQSEVLGLCPAPEYVARRDGFYEPDGQTRLAGATLEDMKRVDAAFVAIPTTADGADETADLGHLLRQGTIAVTAAKGASANNYAELRQLSRGGRLLGDTATVGGGTGLFIPLAEYLSRPDINEAWLALNGTFAAITSSTKPPAEATEDAVAAGLAEPGSTSPLEVARAELDDVAYKTAIIINKLNLGEPIDWRTLRLVLSDEQIEEALAEHRRLMVSMHPKGSEGYSLRHGLQEMNEGFNVWHGNWRVRGGFAQLGRNNVRAMLEQTTGPDIGFAVGLGPDNRNGIYGLTGPGAGPHPTASTMLRDWMRLRSGTEAADATHRGRKQHIRTTTISLDSIETGNGYDESALDEQSFYAVNNWRTGWEPVFSVSAAKSRLFSSSLMSEVLDKAQELEKRGYQLQLTTTGVTVCKGNLTIQHSDDVFEGMTVWAIRDQDLHDRYYGPQQVEEWLGLYIQRSQLPKLVYNGKEAELVKALLPYASIYTHEIDAASRQAVAEEDRRPKPDDFEDANAFVQAYTKWHENRLDPTARVNSIWDRQLNIEPTNNLWLLFSAKEDGTPSYETPLTRDFMSRLEAEDPQFVAAARVAAEKLSGWFGYELKLARQGEDLSPSEQQESRIRTWICEMYATEAQKRFQDLGATDEDLARLRN